LADQFLLAATAWAGVLTEALLGCFGATGLVFDTSQCSLTFDDHYRSSGGLMASKQ